MDSIEGRVLGYLIIKHPTIIRANTTEMTVMPHLIVQEGIAPHYFLDWFTIEGFSFNELFHVLMIQDFVLREAQFGVRLS